MKDGTIPNTDTGTQCKVSEFRDKSNLHIGTIYCTTVYRRSVPLTDKIGKNWSLFLDAP